MAGNGVRGFDLPAQNMPATDEERRNQELQEQRKRAIEIALNRKPQLLRYVASQITNGNVQARARELQGQRDRERDRLDPELN
jgi:hypothetical protein